jgi:hypothetical protein
MGPELVREAELINQYLCKIKNNLPLWIKLNRKELNEILDEIEDHIWEKAVENSENQSPNEIDLQIAISQIGDPKIIANKYTAKSTPRVFISNELYPYYLRYLKIAFLSCIFSLIFPFTYSFIVFGIDLEILSLYLRIYILVFYISLGLMISLVFFYLSTHGYLPYEARITRFYNKFANLAYIQKNSIKNPINARFLVIWALIWLAGAISFYLLSVITVHPIDPPNPIGYFYCIFCSILFVIKLIRLKFKDQLEILHRILTSIEFLLIFSFSALYIFIDYRHQGGIKNFDVIVFLLIGLQILGFPIVLITSNYKIYQIFSMKNRYEQYQTFVSLRKRIIKKQSYITQFNDISSGSLKNDPENQTVSLKDFRQGTQVEEQLTLYINTTRKKLPIWLKKSEKNLILNEIDSEIRELIMDYEDDNQLTPERLTQIFEEVGDANTILLDLKQKGTPKIYISDEIWSNYKGAFKSIVAYFSIIALFFILLLISFNSFYIGGLPMLISLIWLFFSIVFLLVTGIFVILSMSDYIPYNRRHRDEVRAKMKIKSKNSSWNTTILIIFAFFGLIFIMLGFFQIELHADLRARIVVFFIGFILLFLTGIEIILLFLHRRFAKVRISLLIVSLILLLTLNFIMFYNFHAQLGFLHYVIFGFLFFFLFFLLNIGIIYTIFRIFQVNIQQNQLKGE